MRFSNVSIQEMLTNTDPKRLLVFARIEFPEATIRAHSGVGDRTYLGQVYKGVGTMANVSAIKENGGRSANRISLSIRHDDPSLFSQVVNQNPIGRECELHLVKLDKDRQIVGGELLFSGEIADYTLEKGKPYTISVTASDWFEIWGKPVDNSKVTDQSQQHRHPGDRIFDQVEKIAQGIDDTIPGRRIGSRGRRGGGGSGGRQIP